MPAIVESTAAERWHMLQSVERGDAARVLAMLELGFNPNMVVSPDPSTTLLTRGAAAGHERVVRLLIEYGATFDLTHFLPRDGSVAAERAEKAEAAAAASAAVAAEQEARIEVLKVECTGALDASKRALDMALAKAAAAAEHFGTFAADSSHARCKYCWRPATVGAPEGTEEAIADAAREAAPETKTAAAETADAATELRGIATSGGAGAPSPAPVRSRRISAEGGPEHLAGFWSNSGSETDEPPEHGEGSGDPAPVATRHSDHRRRRARTGSPPRAGNVAVVNPLTLNSEGKRREFMRHEAEERILMSPSYDGGPGGDLDRASKRALFVPESAGSASDAPGRGATTSSVRRGTFHGTYTQAEVDAQRVADAAARCVAADAAMLTIAVREGGVEAAGSAGAAEASAQAPRTPSAPHHVPDDAALADEIAHEHLPRLKREYAALKKAGERAAAATVARRFKALRKTVALLSPPRTRAALTPKQRKTSAELRVRIDKLAARYKALKAEGGKQASAMKVKKRHALLVRHYKAMRNPPASAPHARRHVIG